MYVDIKKNIFSSKVAKRIFGLFIISTFIPLFTISIVTYSYLSSQLERDVKRELYRESRAQGLNLYDRFLSLKTALTAVNHQFTGSEGIYYLTNDEWVNSLFNSVFIISESGDIDLLYGDKNMFGHINFEQYSNLQEGKTILQIPGTGKDQDKLYFIQRLNNQNEIKILVGEAKDEYVWNFEVYAPAFLCVTTESNKILFCSDHDIDTDEMEINLSEDKNYQKDYGKININEQVFFGKKWELFLTASFNSENLYILLVTPQQTVYSSFSDFKTIFPKAILASVLLIFLLSIHQIRQYLIPLEKLTEATKNITRGIFNKPVSIKSNDEFEILADSFNNMVLKIDDQIKTITTLAEIDRMILSSLDTDYIIETLINHLHSVLKTNHIAVVTCDSRSETDFKLYINSDREFNTIERKIINVSLEELEELNSCDNYLLLDSEDERSYSMLQKKAGDSFFAIFPVHYKEQLTGIICLSSDKQIILDENKLKNLRDLTDRVAVALSNAAWEQKLFYQAHYDALTKLPNRLLFRDRVEQTLAHAKRNDIFFALLFIDLDKFKDINDSLGHSFGDELLNLVGKKLTDSVRSYDVISRFGGDEYAIMISGMESLDELINKTKKLVIRIIERVSSPVNINGHELYITPSIGIAIYPRDGVNFDELMKNADTAMYNSKKKERGGYEFYDASYNENILERLELRNSLRHALKNDQFHLVYQPKVDCKSGNVISAEVLLRWEHPEYGLVSPEKFIPIAEESGLISTIGFWVLETACMQNKIWLEKGNFTINMAVNLSPEQFRQEDLCSKLIDVLHKNKLPPQHLELEITESITVENYKKTIKVLNEFSRYGVSISIDDFGTGYSSMSYLQKFPINRLKIDKSFTSSVPDDIDSVSIIRAIIALAHSLNIIVVAEGIETKEQYELLGKLGCDELQGYFISRPLQADDFETYLLEKQKTESSVKVESI